MPQLTAQLLSRLFALNTCHPVFPAARFAILLLLIANLAGCGGSEIPRASVRGTVTLEGTPVETGTIRFVPQSGVTGPPIELEIKAGKFQSSSTSAATVGMNSVQIVASRATGKKIKTIMGEEADEVEQYIPAKYNEASELTAEVQPRGNDFQFDLKAE